MGIRTALATTLFAAMVGGISLQAQDVSVDYDHTAAFNTIKTYTWAKVQATDPLVEPRITIAVDHILQGYGWHLVSKNADVAVSAVDATRNSREYAKFYSTLAAYQTNRSWGGGGFDNGMRSPNRIHTGTLIVDFYSQATDKLMWRGMATEPSGVTEKKKEDTIDKTVASMFKHFPPNNGGKTAPNQVSVPDSPSSETVTGNN